MRTRSNSRAAFPVGKGACRDVSGGGGKCGGSRKERGGQEKVRERENSSSQTTEEKLTIHLRSLPNDCSLNITSLNRPDFHRRCRDCRSSSSPRRTIFTRLSRSTSSRDGRSDERRGRLYGRSSRYRTPPPRYLRSSADTSTLRSEVENVVCIAAEDVEPDTLSPAFGQCVGDVF